MCFMGYPYRIIHLCFLYRIFTIHQMTNIGSEYVDSYPLLVIDYLPLNIYEATDLDAPITLKKVNKHAPRILIPFQILFLIIICFHHIVLYCSQLYLCA